MKLYKAIWYLLAAPAIVMSMASCHSHGAEAEHSDEHGHEHEAGEIVLEPHDAERLGVKADTLKPGDFVETLKVSGEILPSSAGVGMVSAPTTGIVRMAAGINEGSQVKAGQAIANIVSSGVSGGDVNAAAKVAVDNARRELDRLTPLLADGLITKKEYNETLAAYEAAKAAYSPAAATGVATAPRGGVVTSLSVSNGQFVETGGVIATIAASGNLTLRALVPASRSAFLTDIDGAVMSFHDGRTVDIADFDGKLMSSAKTSGGATPGYVPVFFSFSSAGAPVVPGSAAEVYLKGRKRHDVIAVPLEAIVEQMGETFVFVREGDHAYIKRPVSLGQSDGSRVEILGGVTPGEVVVIAGSTFVRLAEQATVAPEGHSHNH